MINLIYLSNYSENSLSQISFKLTQAMKNNLKYTLMIVFIVVVTVIAQISVDDIDLKFFFNTALFVSLILLLKLSHNIYAIYSSMKSVFQIQLNLKEIENYLFSECNGISDRTVIARVANLICIITESKNSGFYTVIGNIKTIHKSEVNATEDDMSKFSQTLSLKKFAEINENW